MIVFDYCCIFIVIFIDKFNISSRQDMKLSRSFRWEERSIIYSVSRQNSFFLQIHADQLFLATQGISLENGLTNHNMYETPVKQNMIEAAREVILLADHEKFSKVALSPFAQLNGVHKIITDEKTPDELITQIRSQGLRCLLLANDEF